MVSLPEPLYLATGGANRYQAFENRLLRTKILVTRTMAEREREMTLKTHDILLGFSPLDWVQLKWKRAKHEARKQFGMALQSNSAFQNLINRRATQKDVVALLKSKDFMPVNTGVTEFSWLDATWLFNGAKSETFNIEDLTTSEDCFFRDEVSTEESFKVGGLTLKPIVGKKIQPITTVTRVGLYQINTSMLEWSNQLGENLRELRGKFGSPIPHEEIHSMFNANPEWVNDDTHLIARAIKDTADKSIFITGIILISDDRRLGNQMKNFGTFVK